jgi:hypothetical protein
MKPHATKPEQHVVVLSLKMLVCRLKVFIVLSVKAEKSHRLTRGIQ